jgi:hypothetical protein
MEARAVSATPDRYFETAAAMRAAGMSLKVILEAIIEDGGQPVDLVRVVKHLDGVSNVEAVRLIKATGLAQGQLEELTILVEPDDPYYDWLSGARSDANDDT